MAQQHAIIIHSPKAPFTLGFTDIPPPNKGEVLLKICSVGLNPGNWKQREFDALIDAYPAVVGNDVAGIIESVGEGVVGFKRGDRVFTQTLGGGFQQYTTVPAAILIRIPDNVSFDEVATLPIAFTTAVVGLFAPAPLGLGLNPTFSWEQPQKGDSALVIGGATSVGQFAIQLFKFLGFTRIVAYASKTHFDYLQQLGATECIDRFEVSMDSLPERMKSPVNVVFDITSGNPNAAYDCVADGGGIATLVWGAKLDRDLGPKKVDLEHKKATLAAVRGYLAGPDVLKFKRDDVFGYAGTPEHTEFGKSVIKHLPELLEKGVINANRYEVLPNGLAGILEGMERLRNGTVAGDKLVAHPHDPSV
ncbi:GroES-like protein [Favolaschia claudopus]|uniref:GroES-like protein n=1 Tax=Favolaschia claudopus TaxID=2862362 RepID=A0AAW0EFG1_9AGAR